MIPPVQSRLDMSKGPLHFDNWLLIVVWPKHCMLENSHWHHMLQFKHGQTLLCQKSFLILASLWDEWRTDTAPLIVVVLLAGSSGCIQEVWWSTDDRRSSGVKRLAGATPNKPLNLPTLGEIFGNKLRSAISQSSKSFARPHHVCTYIKTPPKNGPKSPFCTQLVLVTHYVISYNIPLICEADLIYVP